MFSEYMQTDAPWILLSKAGMFLAAVTIINFLAALGIFEG